LAPKDKYRVEQPEDHPDDSDLPDAGHSRLRNAEHKDEVYFFGQQFTDPMAEYIVNCSNKEGREFTCPSSTRDWKPMALGELYCIIGIVMYMGLVKLPAKEDYWSPGELNVSTPVAQFMAFYRFQMLTREMLTTDASKDTQPPKESAQFDKLWRIRPFLTLFQNALKAAYTLGRFVSVDEMMVKFKGRCPVKCYMPKKPTKWGLKIWAACCAATGYLWNFSVYAGANLDDGHDMSGRLGEQVVLNLTADLPVRAAPTHPSSTLVPSAQTDSALSGKHLMRCRSEPTGITDVARRVTVTLL